MSPMRSLGDILMELGKLTSEDAQRALAHQREHGGYFGEALVTLGIVSQGEIEWGLASQHDLPYVFPDPEAIDPAAAALASPDWALAHLTLPMMRTGDVLTVVVDSPLRIEAAEELARRAGCEVQVALAAPARIRDAVRAVYGREAGPPDDAAALPCGLEEALARIDAAGADRFGVSVRDGRARVWWDAGGTIHRRALDARWAGVLSDRMEPDLPLDPVGPFEARLSMGGPPARVEVRCLDGEGGREILFRREEDPDAAVHRFSPPPAAVVSEIRLLSRSGAARVLVTGEPPSAATEILPHLPGLLFDDDPRIVHLWTDESGRRGPGLGLRLPEDPETRRSALEDLRAFQVDVVTVALDGLDGPSLNKALDAAAVCFVLGHGPRAVTTAHDAGVRWQLHLTREDGGHLDWVLHALER